MQYCFRRQYSNQYVRRQYAPSNVAQDQTPTADEGSTSPGPRRSEGTSPVLQPQSGLHPLPQLRQNIEHRDRTKKVRSKAQVAAVLRKLVREQAERRAAGAGGGAAAGAPVPATPAGNPAADGSGPMDT